MNLFTISTGAGSQNYQKTKSVFAGNLPGLHNSILKSTQEKMERQQKAENEIAFWEKQKENLKQKECDTVEEIAKKLEAFHNYEDEIAAVKKAYNMEQMSHILDEAEEQGRKNAEAAEKLEPKTPEERREEMVEEALGTDEGGESVLEEVLDEVTEQLEEVTEQLEENQEQLEEMQEQVGEMPEQLLEGTKELLEGAQEHLEETQELADSNAGQLEKQMERIEESSKELRELQQPVENNGWRGTYRRVDIRV